MDGLSPLAWAFLVAVASILIGTFGGLCYIAEKAITRIRHKLVATSDHGKEDKT